MRALIRNIAERLIPAPLLSILRAAYHFMLGWSAAIFYGLPAQKLFVVVVTGTKGKSSTCEMVNAVLEGAGYRTVLASTIRFKVLNESRPNLFKMTMPGYGHLQKVLAEAVRRGATHAVVEVTSEGARQARNAALFPNALIFTNIAPEHIESHGSYENYKKAKIKIGMTVAHSHKRPRIIVANPEDEVGARILALPAEEKARFSLKDAAPYRFDERSASLTWHGATFSIPFPGEFSILNALAASALAEKIGIAPEVSARALSQMKPISGRVETIDEGQPFLAVVDYAHTPDSLRALYSAYPNKRKICVLGNTGGGRDRWKRPEMGKIADESCAEVILTNEDPYDENPRAIVEEMAAGMKRVPRIVMDRREAIAEALALAAKGDAVLVSGKGTDPYIMEARGTRTPWSDAAVVREELKKLITKRSAS